MQINNELEVIDYSNFTDYRITNSGRYIQTRDRTLAEGLVYLGYTYLKFNDLNGKVRYSFIYSDQLVELCEMLKTIRKGNK